MFIKIICIVALLDFSLSEYDALILPMEKNSKYGDDVCFYTDKEQHYVKPCEKGKFCRSTNIDTLDYARGKDVHETSTISICQDLPNINTLYTSREEGCKHDFECEIGYKCIGNVCSDKCDSGEFYYDGFDRPIAPEPLPDPNNPSVPITPISADPFDITNPYDLYSSSGCKDNSDKGSDGVCYETTLKNDGTRTNKFGPPVKNKICGKLTFDDDPRASYKGIYYVTKYEYVYKGEVEDGEYVNDQELCKSGFALYFFKDGKSEDPKDESAISSNELYLRCVTPISISKSKNDENLINYKINEDGKILIYNLNRLQILTNSPYTKYYEIYDAYFDNPNPKYNFNFFVKYIQLKYEKYREYYTSMTEEERKTCGDLDGTNKYTCENNKLIRSWYFYNHPDKYSAYNDRKKIRKIVDYLIQKEYPCYSLSQFLSIKFIYLLFLLLF